MIIDIRYLAIGLVFLCCFTGYLLGASSNTEGEDTVPENWHIKLKISGGFAGHRRTMELSSKGQLRVIDQKLSKQAIAQVSEKELREIASCIDSTKLIQPSGRLPNCLDCFQYVLEVRINGNEFTIQLNDVSLAGSGMESLVSMLLSLQEKTFKEQ